MRCGDVSSPRPAKLHWVHRYLALPYVPGGRSSAGVDCWGLLRLVYAVEFGIALPTLPGICAENVLALTTTLEEEKLRSWTEVPQPFDGCAVGMSQRTQLHHVGIYAAADGGKVIHCWSGNNCVHAETFRQLWLKGFLVIKFYRHKLWST